MIGADRTKRITFTLPRGFQPADVLPARLLTYGDECRYFVSLVVVKTALKDTDQWGCVRLRHDILRRYMDPNRIAPIVRALQDGGVVEVFPHCAGIKAKGYRMTTRWTCVPSVRVPCTDPRLLDRILAERQQQTDAEKATWLPVHHALRVEQYGLTITSEAEHILGSLPAETREAVTLSQSVLIDRIRRREYSFTVGTTGRIFNAFSSLKRELREALRLRGEPLGHVDIRNSQPALLGLLLTGKLPPSVPNLRETLSMPLRFLPSAPPPLDCTAFALLASEGVLYESLVRDTGLTRDAVKLALLKHVLTQRRRFPSAVQDMVRQRWPSVWAAIRHINRDRGELIRALQRVESWLVIETVAPRLIGRVPVVTLHDAIYSRRREVNRVVDAFRDVFAELGCNMSLKVEGQEGTP